MRESTFQTGCRVRVTGYSPFRGLTGTVQIVDTIYNLDDRFCYYLILFDSLSSKGPIWFEDTELEVL